ncbi:hypothetical protein ENSA7_28620 [Enhygromyxa salina]|uniref:Uncharacterized protein n=2 Tax=Enhygromyxa salina TaxID=215803 RepID=A0A2S9YQY1_9BACT|nr:hypothetical protein ENSA7_28620 [Enhygromyxa salina]
MVQAIALTLGTLAPPFGPPAPMIDRATIEITDTDATITGYDPDGGPVGTLTLFADPADGTIVVVSDYTDGYSWIELDATTGNTTIDGTLSRAVVASRAADLGAALGYPYSLAEPEYSPQPGAGWLQCGGGVVLTAIGLAAANPFALGTAILAACACLPLLFEGTPEGDVECP